MDLDTAIQNIKLGSAICFLGAGFSIGAKDANGNPLFGIADLRDALFELAGQPPHNEIELSDIANFCQKKDPETAQKLKTLILERFTLTRPNKDQTEILCQPWRSVFTTNYDDIPEQVWQDQPVQIFSPTNPDKPLLPGRRLFYLHGRGRDIRDPDIDPLLILSSLEYAQAGKSHQILRDYFSNEMATCKAIIFVGYSAKDLDFTRQMAQLGGSVKERTIFIEHPDINPINRTRIEGYGRVEAIGITKFAKLIQTAHVPEVLKNRPLLVREILIDDPERTNPKPATDTDIQRQLLTGEFNLPAYTAQRQADLIKGRQCTSIIPRIEKLERVSNLIKHGNQRIVVTSDLGNGRTFFLRLTEQWGLDEGYRVFRIDGAGPEYTAELETIFNTSGKKLFVVDDAIRYRTQLQFISKRMTSSCVLIISSSGSFEHLGVYDLREILGGQIYQVDLNKLSANEIQEWKYFLDRWGLWGNHAGLSSPQKKSYLSQQCGKEVRSIIVSLYRHSSIAAKITNIVNYFINTNDNKNRKNAFVGAIITSLANKNVHWKNVVDWLEINENQFLQDIQNSPACTLIVHKDGNFLLPSPQLARFFLKNNSLENVNTQDIADIYTKIVLGTARQVQDKRSEWTARENLKELMRFRILADLFGSSIGGLRIISSIYNRLASDKYIQKRDQFWLQFAIARMAEEDLILAENYLDHALGLAKGYGQDWDTKQIQNQYSRLWLRQIIEEKKVNLEKLQNALENIETTLAIGGGEEIYAIRSAKYMEPLLEKHIVELDNTTRKRILEILRNMKERMGKSKKWLNTEKGETAVLRKHVQNSILIIENA